METSIKSRLEYQPDALQNLLFAVHAENAVQRPNKDKWSVAENIAHLGRYHAVFMERMQRILVENDPLFERYVADKDPVFAEWSKMEWQPLLDKFYASRAKLNAFLFSLTDDQLKYTGRHPVFGRMTITGWTEFFLLHEAHHFFTIFKLVPQIIAAE